MAAFLCLHLFCMYIYIEREREREREFGCFVLFFPLVTLTLKNDGTRRNFLIV